MTDPHLVTVLEGDILQPDMGLSPHDLARLSAQVNLIVHCASSISLSKPLEQLVGVIAEATERLTNMALRFQHLECFVFVSSAYANGHLFALTDGTSGIKVKESLYPLHRQGTYTSAVGDLEEEWCDVQRTGSSPVFREHKFPWAYAYAKHLTERLLDRAFASTNTRLLIMRPSIIDSAQRFPYRDFCLPMSTPRLIFTAGIALSLSRVARFSSHFDNPSQEATIDLVPVDVVVDRLLAHTAQGTSGPVHAVAGPARIPSQALWDHAIKHRRFPWTIRLKWTRQSWDSKDLHPIARFYCIHGTSFEFEEEKTTALWGQLSDSQRSELHLFTDIDILKYDYGRIRGDHIWVCLMHFTRRRRVARWLVKSIYRPLLLGGLREMTNKKYTCRNHINSLACGLIIGPILRLAICLLCFLIGFFTARSGAFTI